MDKSSSDALSSLQINESSHLHNSSLVILYKKLENYIELIPHTSKHYKLFGRLVPLRQEFYDIFRWVHIKDEPDYEIYRDNTEEGETYGRIDLISISYARVDYFYDQLRATCRPFRWNQYTNAQKQEMITICDKMLKELENEPPRSTSLFDMARAIHDTLGSVMSVLIIIFVLCLSIAVLQFVWLIGYGLLAFALD